ncbi:MAG: hypothetical protein M0R37_10405 [Bacteroidales bacterium]|nr:hypothetical protein [Bacteroidales bacterium]
MRYTAKPRLRDRLIQLNGGEHGYLHKLRAAMARNHRDTELPSIDFLSQAVNVYKNKATPPWQVVEIVRYVERALDMPESEAYDRAPMWFDIKGGGDQHDRADDSTGAAAE